MALSYKLDTHTYALNADQSQLLDFHRPIAELQFDLNVSDYNTGAAGSVKYDAHPFNLVDTIRVGEGSRFPFTAKGRDLYYLHWLLKKTKPSETVYTSANAANKTARARVSLPMPLNKGAFTRPKLQVEWSGDLTGDIGADQTVDAASLNGAITFSENPVPEFSLFGSFDLLNKSGGTVKDQIPAEGRLSSILLISRNATSKNRDNTALDDVSLRLEGIIEQERAFATLENEMQTITDDALEAGVGLIDLKDTLPLIGSSSYVFIELGGTAMDLTVYYLFEGVKQQPTPTNKNEQLAAGNQKQAPITQQGLPGTIAVNPAARGGIFTPRRIA